MSASLRLPKTVAAARCTGLYSYEPGGDVQVLMQGDSRKMVGIEAAGRFSLVLRPRLRSQVRVGRRSGSSTGPTTTTTSGDGHRYLGEAGGKAYAAGGTGDHGVMVSMTPSTGSAPTTPSNNTGHRLRECEPNLMSCNAVIKITTHQN